MASEANKRQVGGAHYKGGEIEHWDWVTSAKIPYLEGVATKYIARHFKKNGFEDMLKALHYCEKIMEVYYPEEWAAHKAEEKAKALPASGLPHQFSNHIGWGCKYCGQSFVGVPPGEPCPKR